MSSFVDFDIKNYEPLTLEPLPKNQYKLRITDAKMNLTKRGKMEGSGERAIRLDLTVEEGEYTGRVICDFLNIENPSEKAREYSRRKLRTLCTLTDTVDKFSVTKDLNVLVGGKVGAEILLDNTMEKPANKINFYLRPEKVVDLTVHGVSPLGSPIMETKGKPHNPEPNDDIPF